MSWLLNNIFATFLLPPLSLIVTLMLGTWLLDRRQKLGKSLIWLSLAMFWLLGTPWVGRMLLTSLEPPPAQVQVSQAQAIVVLGGGIHPDTPEYGGDTLKSQTLERLRYAARLHRHSRLPMLLTGGRPEGGMAEAELMAESLRTDFGIAPQWMETASENTAENARFSRDILRPVGIDRILLVTHASHMPRAAAAFAKAGFTVLPAPTMGNGERPFLLLDLLPSASGLMQSRTALHEWLGLLWYRLLSRT